MAEDQKPTSSETVSLETRAEHLEQQLNDVIKDRDKWREIAKEATSNVKLIINQAAAPKNNDNMMIFIAVAFVVGIGVAYMMLRDDVTPSDVTVTPKNSPSPLVSYYLGWNDGIRVQEGLEPIGRPTKDTGVLVEPTPKEETTTEQLSEDSLEQMDKILDGWIAGMTPEELETYEAELAKRDSMTPEEREQVYKEMDELLAEQGADVTDSVTPELQADNGSN
jgi:hypothetical protein